MNKMEGSKGVYFGFVFFPTKFQKHLQRTLSLFPISCKTEIPKSSSAEGRTGRRLVKVRVTLAFGLNSRRPVLPAADDDSEV